MSESWLAKRRMAGRPPAYLKLGKIVLYEEDELNRFLATCRRQSTSEADFLNRKGLPPDPAAATNLTGAAMTELFDYLRLGWDLKLVAAGEKASWLKDWPDLRPSPEELQRHLDHDGNLGVRLGRSSGDLIDIDLDCPEALQLADLYLPPNGAEFGRVSKPRSHRLYRATDGVFAAFADPLDGSMLVEFRSDGATGGAHLTLIPPSIADGERRRWHGDTIEPHCIGARILKRRIIWFAIGCLVMRHVSEHAARRPGPDLPELLWEAEPRLGRAAFHWLGEPSPDEPKQYPKPRTQMTNEELRLAEVVAAIRNDFDWHGWNRIGMAIYAASGGSEEGYIAFDDLSAHSPKYDPYTVKERWRNYRRSPPNRIGIGTLVHIAREHGWRRRAA